MSNSDAPDLDRFINKFGTHAHKEGSFGGKAVVSTIYNAMVLADCGVDGEIYLDASKGFCDKSGSTGNCQLVNNGTFTDQAECNLSTELFSETRGYSIGSPKMAPGLDLLPHSRLDSWMLLA